MTRKLRVLMTAVAFGCGETSDAIGSTDAGTDASVSTSAPDGADTTEGDDGSTDESPVGSGDDTADGSGGDPTEGSGDDPTDESGEGSTGGTGPELCEVAQVQGVCDDVNACAPGSTAFGGALCDGPPTTQCCVPAEPPCSVLGAPGLCMSVDACASPFVATAGLCPGDATVQCCTDPDTACDPDAMPRPNEGLVEEAWDPACPLGMVTSADVCVDRYEASLVELDNAGDVVESWSPWWSPGTTRVRAVSLRGAIPQGYITQLQASAACMEAGKRLCTDAEWLRVCRGAANTTYPWGDAAMPGTCNDARAVHPAVEYFGTSDPSIFSMLDHPCISQIPASLDTTGEHDGCVSEDGAFDLMGNLHEWTADPAGTLRGGFFVDTTLNGPGCLYATTAHAVTYSDYSTGFRCCADPG